MSPRDTDPEVQRLLDEHNRELTPSDRGGQLLAASEVARPLQFAGLRHDHPDASEAKLLEEFYRRRLGDEDGLVELLSLARTHAHQVPQVIRSRLGSPP